MPVLNDFWDVPRNRVPSISVLQRSGEQLLYRDSAIVASWTYHSEPRSSSIDPYQVGSQHVEDHHAGVVVQTAQRRWSPTVTRQFRDRSYEHQSLKTKHKAGKESIVRCYSVQAPHNLYSSR